MTTTDSVASLTVPEWSQVRMHRKLGFIAVLWILFVLTALNNVLASLSRIHSAEAKMYGGGVPKDSFTARAQSRVSKAVPGSQTQPKR